MRLIYKLEMMLAVTALLIVGVLFLGSNSGASITGYVSASNITIYIQNLDLYADGTQTFSIASTGGPLNLKFLSLDGDIVGDGRVEIFIDNNQGIQYLIYENVDKEIDYTKGRSPITGMFVDSENSGEITGNVVEDNFINKVEGTWLIVQPNKVNIPYEFRDLNSDEKKVSGQMHVSCMETCDIPFGVFSSDKYRLIFRIENGTYVQIKKLEYILHENE